MTQTVSMAALRAASWSHVESQLSELTDVFAGETLRDEEEIGRSSFVDGYTVFAASLPGCGEVRLCIPWTAGGSTKGSFSDLYRFRTPKVDPECDGWSFEPMITVTDGGDPMDWHTAALALADDVIEWESAAQTVLPACPKPEQVEEMEMKEGQDELEEFVVERDDAPSLAFRGKILARESSSPDQGQSDYSGSTGRWKELTLYRTAGGKFVCEKAERTQWQGERDRLSAAVANDAAGVIKFFGHSRIAKALYDSAGIADVERVD